MEEKDYVVTKIDGEYAYLREVDKGEETEQYFLNPYNALYKDENGYYAVIEGNKYSNVRRPVGFNPNQMKKIVKETFDEYVNDFKNKFTNEKELISFTNALKADVNKADF